MKITIYGAAGIVGRGLRRVLAGKHDLVLVDRAAMEQPEGQAVTGDVSDPELFRQTAPGADVLVYLPYAPFKGGDECTAAAGASFDVNVRGVYYCLAVAHELRIPRVIYTSTYSVFDMSPEGDHGIHEETPPRPMGKYALTKWMGEEVCRYFTSRYPEMTAIVLRLCGVRDPSVWEAHKRMPDRRHPLTHSDDVGRAIELCLAAPVSGFQLFHIFGERNRPDWSEERAKAILGFAPVHI